MRTRRARRRVISALVGAILLALAAPSLAGAACTKNWKTAANGAWETASNWQEGAVPNSADDVCIQIDGTYTVTIASGQSVKSLALGALTPGSGPVTLAIIGGTNVGLTINGGGTVNPRGAITLDSAAGGVNFDLRDSTLTSAGTLTTLGANPLTLSGHFVNTGAVNVNGATSLSSGVATPTGTLVNQGTFTVANATTFTVSSPTAVTNAGGSITTGTGTFAVGGSFEQGAGATTTSGNPLVVTGGTLSYTGGGGSNILINSGATLSGASVAGQALRIRSDTGNTNVTASGGFSNGGTLTLDAINGASNGAPHLGMGSATLTNTGTIVSANPSSDASQIAGNLTNSATGTIQVNANLRHTAGGSISTLDNHGTISIASGVTLSSSGSSCGDSTGVVVNNGTGGQIVTTGTGTLDPVVYNQGAGTTSGPTPVRMSCGFLNYTGAGSSQVLLPAGITMSGNTVPGQEVTLTNGTISAGTFTNGGTMTIAETTTGGLGLDVNGQLTNSGTIAVSGSRDTEIRIKQTLINTGALQVMSSTNPLRIRGGQSVAYNCPAICVSNQGDIEVGAGATLTVDTKLTQSAGTTNLGAAGRLATINLDLAGGTLSGLGTVQGIGNTPTTLSNAATVSPGTGSDPGTLTVNGAYTQSSAGTLNARVSASANDRLTVNGAATLSGTLAASSTGTPPPVGQSATVLSDTSQSGTFTTLGGSSSFDVAYDPTAVRLIAKAAPSGGGGGGGGTGGGSGPTASIDSPSVRNPAGDAALTFTVRLSAPPGGSGATVRYATANGVAQSPRDYTASSSTLSFGPAETQKTITVTVHSAAAGPDRTMFVNLSSPVGVSLGQAQGTGTILNDRVALSSVTPAAGGACGVATVVLRGAGFTGAPAVRLTGADGPDIPASNVETSAGGRVLTARFNLSGAKLGTRTVVATLPPFGASSTLPGAFRVEATKPAILSAQLLGPTSSLPDYPWTGVLQVSNQGNVDATDAVVRIDGFHAGAAVRVLGPAESVQGVNSASGHSVVITIRRLAASSSVQFAVRFSPLGPAHRKYYFPVTVVSRGSGCGGGGDTPTTPGPPPPANRPPPPPDLGEAILEVLTSGDPNDKFGPRGYGAGHFVSARRPMPYGIMFENVPSATAPAHEVRITDQLDPSRLDLNSLELGAVYFGDTLVAPPPHLQSWDTVVDLRPANNLLVSISASLDPLTGLLTWDMKGLDPITRAFVLDPARGFLPPDVHPPAGRGGVAFTANQRPGLPTNTRISNAATIVFDRNAPIATRSFVNTLDITAPTSRISSIKRGRKRRACRQLKVSWSGADRGAGVAFYDIYASRGRGKLRLWQRHTTRRSAVYQARGRGLYRFQSVATDGVGNVQAGRPPIRKSRVAC
ncbi:MAG TPA: Calx-beta domain-containing protein [Solirubrobacteraceae bacterium]|nr:Calx-beta domain-containing protein [Solirubrobacteraceae bacterium]